jgi:hypothetical protein
MMKRTSLILFLAVLPAAAQWRHFGDRTRLTGYFGVGGATALNPVARALDPGWTLSGGVGATNRYVGFMVEAMFVDFGLNRTTLYYAGVPRGSQKYWSLTAAPTFHVNQRGPVDFYLTAGGGLYSRITEYRAGGGRGPFYWGDDLLGSDTTCKPGVNGGAGFAFNVVPDSNVKIFAEARYHHMFTRGSGASFVPVTLGIRF